MMSMTFLFLLKVLFFFPLVRGKLMLLWKVTRNLCGFRNYHAVVFKFYTRIINEQNKTNSFIDLRPAHPRIAIVGIAPVSTYSGKPTSRHTRPIRAQRYT